MGNEHIYDSFFYKLRNNQNSFLNDAARAGEIICIIEKKIMPRKVYNTFAIFNHWYCNHPEGSLKWLNKEFN